MMCVFQSTLNKLVSVVLSVTKDIPLWTYSHLQYKQQQVRQSSLGERLLPESQSHSSVILCGRWSRRRFATQVTTSR